MEESRLIRFVVGPEGAVTPDLACKLPGRGLWVAATRSALETAAAKGGFSRVAKTKVAAGSGLADLVERLLAARILAGLGLARRAGALTSGFEKVRTAVQADKAAWLIEATDGAADGRRKLIGLAERRPNPPRVLAAFSAGELGLALGGENVIHLAFLAGRGAERWTVDVERFSGFRPLLPQSWREEP